MSAPTPRVRAAVYERDHHRCVACGSAELLEFQHRRRVGMGGDKERPRAVAGIALCTWCNRDAEGATQQRSLILGHKVRGWVRDCADVPVCYPFDGGWHRLTEDRRIPITEKKAHRMMKRVYGDEYLGWLEDN